jgi:protein-S-isoprenylcysteine O-methyltransferase Ste14
MTIQPVDINTVGFWPAMRLRFAGGATRHARVVPAAISEPALSTRALVFDTGERLIVAAMFGVFACRMALSYSITADVSTLLVILAEAVPFYYIVVRAPSPTLSQRPTDWFFGIVGSMAPLLITPGGSAPLVPEAVCFAIMLTGMFIQVAAKIVLGRSFGIVAANRGVKMLGPYRFVRHPMYAGYSISHIGFLLARPSLLNAAIYAAVLSLQIVRIFREERILKQDPIYQEFASRVRYRLLPGVF